MLRRNVFSFPQFLHAIVCALLTVASGTAWAQEQDVSNSATHCAKSTMTREEFMEMFRAIAMHGDLTDIPFIEKTLHVKFISGPTYHNGKPNYNRVYYLADIPDVPIQVSINVTNNAVDIVAEMEFQGNFFGACPGIHLSQFERALGSDFTQKFSDRYHDSALPGVGMNGTNIHVVYMTTSGKKDDELVQAPGIKQYAKGYPD